MPLAAKLHTDIYKHNIQTIWKNIPARLCIVEPTGGISNLVNELTSKNEIIARETTVTGVGRASATLTDIGGYNIENSRWEVPSLQIQLSATSNEVQYYQTFLLLNGSANRPRSFTATAFNTGDDTVTITGHGLSNGEEFILSPTVGSSLPTILAADAQPFIYQAANVTADTFQVSKDGGVSVVNFADAGAGSFYLRYAKGTIERILTEVASDAVTPTLVTIPPGATRNYVIGLFNKQGV